MFFNVCYLYKNNNVIVALLLWGFRVQTLNLWKHFVRFRIFPKMLISLENNDIALSLEASR